MDGVTTARQNLMHQKTPCQMSVGERQRKAGVDLTCMRFSSAEQSRLSHPTGAAGDSCISKGDQNPGGEVLKVGVEGRVSLVVQTETR